MDVMMRLITLMAATQAAFPVFTRAQIVASPSMILIVENYDGSSIELPDLPELKRTVTDNLVSFSQYAIKGKIYLKWVANGEPEEALFIIERSFDNENFEQIAFEETIGVYPGTPLIYSWTDNFSPSGKVFYRIGKVYRDGRYYYSEAAEVNNIEPLEYGSVSAW